MEEKKIKVIAGGLLHDIGKLLYRSDDGRNHSLSGRDYLKDTLGITDAEILEQIYYHHFYLLSKADIADDSLAYITYIADNIASGVDRREKDDREYGFDKTMPLESIFNILNNNDGDLVYKLQTMEYRQNVNYPHKKDFKCDKGSYEKITGSITNNLKNWSLDIRYINSLLEVMEANLSFVPSSTAKKERADISLYDHVKLTAAIGSCIYEYVKENNITDYKEFLFSNAGEFYKKDAFLMYSMDISGIQSFIYTIQSEKALKSLRARSFYLEIMLENMIDNLLDDIGISRANLLYSGGGHAYILLPNTAETIAKAEAFQSKMNKWLIQQFKTDLYVACAYYPCSADNLKNEPEGSYSDIFKNLSEVLSQKKMQRYSCQEIIALNKAGANDGIRECKICHRSDNLNAESYCVICQGLIDLAKKIFEEDFFIVTKEPKGIPLYDRQYLTTAGEKELREMILHDASYIRSYSKNKMYTGQSLATKLWVGDYRAENTFEDLAQKSQGIKRLGVLRADIDNLGQAFIHGFESQKYKNRYTTISRTATFSRSLSLFFKLYINKFLTESSFHLVGEQKEKRNIAVVYSGGDDVFLVGAWNDVIEFAIDLHDNLKAYTQNTLTISAGIGVYAHNYPISYMADEVGELEDLSKAHQGKNAVTLFAAGHTYGWDDFVNHVWQDKFKTIYNFFEFQEEKGKSFLYKLLNLVRNREQKINLARMAYFLARFEPQEKEQQESYSKFAQKIYNWMKNEEESRQLITAVYLYAYWIREKEE